MPLDVLTRPPVADHSRDDTPMPSPREDEPIGARTVVAAAFIAPYLLLTVVPLRLFYVLVGRLLPRRRRRSAPPRPISLEAPLFD